MFYAPGFDPYLIMAQILCLQSLLYLGMGMSLSVLTGIAGDAMATVSLRQLFSADAIRLSFTSGWIPMVAYMLNAVFGCAWRGGRAGGESAYHRSPHVLCSAFQGTCAVHHH